MSDYRELPAAPALAGLVSCGWWRVAGTAETVRVLPDGCVDLVGEEDGTLFVAGPDTGPQDVPLGRGAMRFGVRFRPGSAAAALGVPAADLRDRRVMLADLWGDEAARLEERLAGVPDPLKRVAVLQAAVAPRLRGAAPDALVLAAAARLRSASGERVGALAARLGVSERQLLRRFDAAVGYGPKTLARVLRLRRLLALPRDRGLAWAALEAGYADQPHMNGEVRRLTGTTPAALLR